MTIRVLIADDHPVVRRGLTDMLRSTDDIEVVGEAVDGKEAVRAAVTLHPDVLVLDINMPGLDGMAAAAEIRRAAPTVSILMLTMIDDDEYVRAALAVGASGYALKGDPAERIVRAIHAVADGETVLASGVARSIVNRPDGPSMSGPLAGLTARELQILELLADGHTTQVISRRLGVASKTVSNTLSTIFAKLGVVNRTEAALLARRAGLGTAPR